MKILFITQWFQPEPYYKGMPFIKKLIERGHKVQVLTGFPNYPEGKVYKGYTIRGFQKELMDGVEVFRVPLYPSHDSSPVRRIANYLSFAFSASIIGPWVVKKPDIIYVYHPPPTTYLPAFFIKLFKRAPVVYDIQDFWPDTLAATGMFNNKIGLKLVDIYCRLFYKAADKIVVLSPGFKRKLIEKKVPAEKIEVIYNWFPNDRNTAVSKPDPQLAKKLGLADRFNVLFAGNMGKAQKLETVLDAAKLLADANPEIQFIFIGGGVEVQNLKDCAVKMSLPNVLFLPRIPKSEIGQILAMADVLLVHLKRDPLFEITIPSKIQAYLAIGKPVLAAVSGDAATLVEKANCGLTCPPENVNEMVKAIQEFYSFSPQKLKKMGDSGRCYYIDNMSIEIGVSCFEKLFQKTTNILEES